MAYVKRDPRDAWMEDGGFEKMLKKFKKKCDNEGIIKEIRNRVAYVPPAEKKRLKRENARKRLRAAEAKRRKYYSNND